MKLITATSKEYGIIDFRLLFFPFGPNHNTYIRKAILRFDLTENSLDEIMKDIDRNELKSFLIVSGENIKRYSGFISLEESGTYEEDGKQFLRFTLADHYINDEPQ